MATVARNLRVRLRRAALRSSARASAASRLTMGLVGGSIGSVLMSGLRGREWAQARFRSPRVCDVSLPWEVAERNLLKDPCLEAEDRDVGLPRPIVALALFAASAGSAGCSHYLPLPAAERAFLNPDGKVPSRLLPGQLPQSSAVEPLPRELFIGGRGEGPVLTPEQADQVVRAMWLARERAGAQDNAPMLARLETGAARDWNVAETRLDIEGFGRSARIVRPMGASETVIPYRTSYPAYFMAVVQTRTYPTPTYPQPHGYNEIMVLSRRSAREPWKVAIDTGFVGPSFQDDPFLSDPTADRRNPIYNPAPPRPSWINPRRAFPALASYYRSWFETSRPPAHSHFLAGRSTTLKGRAIVASSDRRGVRRRLRYYTDPARDGVYQFSFQGYWNVTCSAVRGQDEESATNRDTALYQSVDRSGWGAGVAPGAYRQISSTFLHQSCIAIGPTAAQSMGVIGGEGSDIEEHAIRSLTVPVPDPAPDSSGILHVTHPPSLIPRDRPASN